MTEKNTARVGPRWEQPAVTEKTQEWEGKLTSSMKSPFPDLKTSVHDSGVPRRDSERTVASEPIPVRSMRYGSIQHMEPQSGGRQTRLLPGRGRGGGV